MPDIPLGGIPLDPNKPRDHEPVSTHARYIRETRQAAYTADIHNIVFESSTETGDAVYLDVDTNTWKRSLGSPDPEFVDRNRFHGIASVGENNSVRVFGFITYNFWAWPRDARIYVSSTNVGKLTYEAPDHNKPLIAGVAVHIDSLLIDQQLSYWEDIKNEVWEARGSYDMLVERLDHVDTYGDRLADVEIEITNAHGSHSSLSAHFDSLTGRIVILESEYEDACDTFDSLGLRLNSMTSRISTLESYNTVVDGRLDSLEDTRDDHEDRISSNETTLVTHTERLDNTYTKPEVDGHIAAMNQDIEGFIQGVLSGEIDSTDNLWTLADDGVYGEAILSCGDGTSFTNGSYFLIDSLITGNFYVWYNIGGSGTDPLVADRTGIEVVVASGDNSTAIATKSADAINLDGSFNASSDVNNLTLIDTHDGEGFSVVDGATNFDIVIIATGKLSSIMEIDGLTEYFLINNLEQLFQGSIAHSTTTRSSVVDADMVTDNFFYTESAGGPVIPRLEILT